MCRTQDQVVLPPQFSVRALCHLPDDSSSSSTLKAFPGDTCPAVSAGRRELDEIRSGRGYGCGRKGSLHACPSFALFIHSYSQLFNLAMSKGWGWGMVIYSHFFLQLGFPHIGPKLMIPEFPLQRRTFQSKTLVAQECLGPGKHNLPPKLTTAWGVLARQQKKHQVALI